MCVCVLFLKLVVRFKRFLIKLFRKKRKVNKKKYITIIQLTNSVGRKHAWKFKINLFLVHDLINDINRRKFNY